MWTPKDLFDTIRRSFATRAEPPPTTPTYHRHPPGEVYARATPEIVRIVETYSYKQEISRNRDLSSDPDQQPKGCLTVVVPFDGDHFFTRQAKSDVAAQIPADNTEATSALVGHVVLTNCGKADFRSVAARNVDTHAIPIRVPVSGPGIPSGYGHLIDDRGSCEITHEYQPDRRRPEIMPVTVTIELRDPDSADFLENSELGGGKAKDVAEKLKKQRVFLPHLELLVKVEVHIAGDELTEPPEVSVSIAWPTVTSPNFVSLMVDNEDYPIRYNPDVNCIEWRNVELGAVKRKGFKQAKDSAGAGDSADDQEKDDDKGKKPVGESDDEAPDDADDADDDKVDHGPDEADEDEADDGDDDVARDYQGALIRTYASPPMSLLILQPGELYREKDLNATVNVRIPRLLSGMQARVYDGTGRHAQDYPPEVVSEVSTQVQVILADAFADRLVSTSQRLHFDEVILDSVRIDDIRNALVADGFEVDDGFEDPEWYDDKSKLGLLFYRRREGTDYLRLVYLLEGAPYATERETVVGSETFKTQLTSGDLKIYSYGTMRRSSREITRAMNRLHQVLRTQFEHVRVRR
jgi:hypothetical protein